MKRPPCEKCPKKGCGSYHDICRKYQIYKKEHEDMRAAKRKDKLIGTYIYENATKIKNIQYKKDKGK